MFIPRLLSFGQTFVLAGFVVVAFSGCSPKEGDPYAPPKQSWDKPPTANQLQALRHRAEMTQQDH